MLEGNTDNPVKSAFIDVLLKILLSLLCKARKLAALLKDAERNNEELGALLKSQQLESERAKTDIQQLFNHNRKLQAVAEEHESLKGSFTEVVQK